MIEEPPIDALKGLAHPLRFKIVEALGRGELNVSEIEEVTEIGQPGLSQQLAVLRKAGLVETRKQAKLVFYRLASAEFEQLCDTLDALAGGATGPGPQRRPTTPGAANFARLT